MTVHDKRQPIRFWFDFASPYAWFAMDRLAGIAARHGRTVEWRPMLLWAVLRKQGITPPQESAVKWDYFMHDMVRSAAFHGVPYQHPGDLPFSAHRAARLFYAVRQDDAELGDRLAHALMRAKFAEGRDIADPAALADIASGLGIDAPRTRAAIEGETGRALLAAAVEEATQAGVCGSPWILLDGEAFFGADRLPQMEWRLSSQAPAPAAPDRADAGQG